MTTTKATSEWLAGLKPGDEVMSESCLRSGYWPRFSKARTTVLRRTPKRIVIRCPWSDAGRARSEWTINVEDGTIIGGSYRGEIRPITDADREREERADLLRKIRWWADETLANEDVSTAKLRAVAAAIDAES